MTCMPRVASASVNPTKGFGKGDRVFSQESREERGNITTGKNAQ